jgi:hypothetical protein
MLPIGRQVQERAMAAATRTDRRAVLLGTAATAFSIGRARAAADFVYKFATNVPLTHPLNIRLQQAFLGLTGHMWDGWWALANRRAWEALPSDLRTLTAEHLNRSALDQRADLADLNTSLRPDLEAKGMVFNEIDKALFRDRLVRAGFYKEWRSRYGEAAWALLEKYAGKLS